MIKNIHRINIILYNLPAKSVSLRTQMEHIRGFAAKLKEPEQNYQ